MGLRRVRVITSREKPVTTGKLVVISGRSYQTPTAHRSVHTISQHRLAHIQEMQSRIGYEQSKLSDEWARVRKDMIAGATVEPGPIRAWLAVTMRFIRRRGQLARTAIQVKKLVIK